tara:strand:+ start:130 stop:459 length:330 start_codon:yes stop_codon:yes gene_type:complete
MRVARPLFNVKKPKQEGDFVAIFKASKPKLSDFLIKHDVCTYYSKNWTIGNPWIAWFQHPASDPEHRSFVQLVERYSMEACSRRNLCASGRDREDACRNLAKLNNLTFP